MASTAREALEIHMHAINKMDASAMIRSQHFPFVHLWPDGIVEFVEGARDFQLPDIDSILGSEWHHSVLESAEKVTQGDSAVSYRVVFSRQREDNSIMGRYEAVWIVTKDEEGWGVQLRHGAVEL